MNINLRRKTIYLAISVLTILLMGACSKNNVYVDVIDPSGSNGGSSDEDNNNGNSQKALVNFSASIEGRNVTRAMSPMRKGLQSWLAVYRSGATDLITGAPIAEGDYISSTVGMLSGIGGYKMYLSNNIYNFYAVSSNSSDPAPTFNNGVSEPLANGVDYLWWNALHQDVTTSQLSIPITYLHVATQVVIVITAGTNITLDKVVSATITPTQPGATMDLSTGIIPSATGFDKATDMGINEFTLQYIMLPVKTSAPMTLNLQLMVNGESNARTYTTSIVPPNNILAAGDSYLFKAVITENTISFPNVSIKDWTEVDKTGKPLHPIQD